MKSKHQIDNNEFMTLLRENSDKSMDNLIYLITPQLRAIKRNIWYKIDLNIVLSASFMALLDNRERILSSNNIKP